MRDRGALDKVALEVGWLSITNDAIDTVTSLEKTGGYLDPALMVAILCEAIGHVHRIKCFDASGLRTEIHGLVDALGVDMRQEHAHRTAYEEKRDAELIALAKETEARGEVIPVRGGGDAE